MAMPQSPFDPFQMSQQLIDNNLILNAFRYLTHGRDFHGDMKPVENVFGLGIEIKLPISASTRFEMVFP